MSDAQEPRLCDLCNDPSEFHLRNGLDVCKRHKEKFDNYKEKKK